MITENGKQINDRKELSDNKIIGDFDSSTIQVMFKGKGNILVVEENVRFADSKIVFCGDNALVYLSSNKLHPYKINMDVWRETVVFFGNDNYFNGVLKIIVSERKNVIIGSEGTFSFGIWMRTADPHIIYQIEDKRRINPSKSILIGDHIWIGQNALIPKGTKVGSGSVLSANTVLANRTVESNSVYAGNPARKIKDHIFYSGKSVHNYTKKDTEKSMKYKGDEYIYAPGESMDFVELDQRLCHADNAEEKLGIIKESLVKDQKKSRFYIPAQGKDAKRSASHGLFRKR